jgi:hypothetical protein
MVDDISMMVEVLLAYLVTKLVMGITPEAYT